MHFIDHIIEPSKLFLAWQSSNEKHRNRYVVAEINNIDNEITLRYLYNTDDFIKAQQNGFESHPAFKDIGKTHHNVLDTFMCRLPPRTRSDFFEYLQALRLKPDVKISNFALLGYSGAKLLSDGFSIIHPFLDVSGPCELLLEAAGYRHIQNKPLIQIGDSVSFIMEFNEAIKQNAIRVEVDKNHIGYINRGLIPTFIDWMDSKRIAGAWIEKINGTLERPVVHIFVKINSKQAA